MSKIQQKTQQWISILQTEPIRRIKSEMAWNRVVKISERNTSKVCHKYGARGIRVGSSFQCPNCGC
ncbi:MAG: zinc ribbon domain-containing protein [Candidatus Asgardarchaeia archaeon]